jgi:phosphatidylglycerophosphatase A
MIKATDPGRTRNVTAPDRSAGVPPAVEGPIRSRAPVFSTLIATFFGIGYLRPGPGTWASASTVLLWSVFAFRQPQPLRLPEAFSLSALLLPIGIPAATRVARASGSKDPQFVVIDEVAGQLIALIGAPLAWKTLLAGFILFRVFDIVKPPPVRQLERLPEGVGIMLDDIAAGIYALIVMQLLLHFNLLK